MTKLTIRDLAIGDIARIGGEIYRLTMAGRDAWGCRKQLEGGDWSDGHSWFTFDVAVEALIRKNPTGKKSNAAKECDIDPIMGMRV